MKTRFLFSIGLASCLLAGCVYDSGPSRPFRGGHGPSYGSNRPPSGAKFFRDGRAQGESDARRGRRNDPTRHFGSIPRHARDDFRRGYSQGFREAKIHSPRGSDPRDRYDRRYRSSGRR